MTYQESYIFIVALSVILAVPFGFALRTLLAMEERVIVPILRMQTEAGEKPAITYKRTVPLVYRIAERPSYIVVAPAKFIDQGGFHDHGR